METAVRWKVKVDIIISLFTRVNKEPVMTTRSLFGTIETARVSPERLEQATCGLIDKVVNVITDPAPRNGLIKCMPVCSVRLKMCWGIRVV